MAQRVDRTAKHMAARLYRDSPAQLRPFLKRAYHSTKVRRAAGFIRPGTKPSVRTPASEQDIARPVVTVVIPARDEQLHLMAAIDSVLCQDLAAVECIVVDDGSIDYTLDVAAEAQPGQAGPRCSAREPARACSVAQYGSRPGACSIRHLLDGDDYLFPGSLTTRTRALQRAAEDVIGVYCDWLPVREDNPPKKPDRPPARKPTVSLSSSDGKPPFIATAPMLRTEAIRQLGGFDETFRSAEDFELWMRALRAGHTFEPVEHVGVAYRQRRSGMVLGNPANHATYMARVYDRADNASHNATVDPGVRAESLAGSAVLAAATGDPAQLDAVVALAAGLPATAFNTEAVADAMQRSVARLRKADNTTHVEGQVDEVRQRLSAATSATPTKEAPGKEPSGPLDPDLATRARSLNEPLITPVHVKRDAFGGVVLCPLARYHVDELVPLADELRKRGHQVSFLLTPREGASVREEMRKYNETLFAWPNSLDELSGYSAVVTLNDWGPVRPLIQRAGDLNVPTFSKVEGVQDFEDVDTGRLRKPYRWTEHVLCQGPNDVRNLAGRSTHIVGNSSLRRLRSPQLARSGSAPPLSPSTRISPTRCSPRRALLGSTPHSTLVSEQVRRHSSASTTPTATLTELCRSPRPHFVSSSLPSTSSSHASAPYLSRRWRTVCRSSITTLTGSSSRRSQRKTKLSVSPDQPTNSPRQSVRRCRGEGRTVSAQPNSLLSR